MQQEPNNATTAGSTQIFRMPATDVTSPSIFDKPDPVYPTLAIVKGPQTGMVFELNTSIITIGRDPSNSIFLNDMTVSRKHARIDFTSLDQGYVTIEDLNSLNGTWIDGAIVNKAFLKDGSTIQIGTFRMIFHTNKHVSTHDSSAHSR